jgi:hypothetical protein
LDANQFQAAVLAWGAAVSSLIAVLLGIALAVRSALAQLTAKNAANTAQIAAVSTTVQHHEKALNGELAPRIEAIADQRIALHRRKGDVTTPIGPTAVPNA